jgi:hypothetical protein
MVDGRGDGAHARKKASRNVVSLRLFSKSYVRQLRAKSPGKYRQGVSPRLPRFRRASLASHSNLYEASLLLTVTEIVLFGIQKGAQLDEKVQVLVSNQLHGEICYFVLSFHSNKHLLQCVQARGISASASQQLSNWTRNTACFQHLTAIGVNPGI